MKLLVLHFTLKSPILYNYTLLTATELYRHFNLATEGLTSCLYREPSLIASPFLYQVKSGLGLARNGILSIIVSPFSNAVVDSNRLGSEILGAPEHHNDW